MDLRELESRMQGNMHRQVTVTKNDGTMVTGYFEPNSDTTVYLVPLDNQQGEAFKVAISDIQSIQVTPLMAGGDPVPTPVATPNIVFDATSGPFGTVGLFSVILEVGGERFTLQDTVYGATARIYQTKWTAYAKAMNATVSVTPAATAFIG